MNTTKHIVLLICTLIGCLSIFASNVSAFSFVPLGDLPGGIFSSTPTGISGDGSIVVGYSASANGTEEAFHWTAETGMVGLGDLAGGVFSSRANAISLDGSTIVGRGSGANGSEALRWTESEGLVSLYGPSDPSLLHFSQANDVSSDGSILVGSASGGSDPIRWTVGSGTTLLSTPEDWVLDGASADAISGDGSLIVGSMYVIPIYYPYSWRADGSDDFLFDPALQQDSTEALAISENGTVVAGFVENYSSGLNEAFRWAEDGGWMSLAGPVDFDGSAARGVSANGLTLVGRLEIESFIAPIEYQAAVWTKATGWRLIEDILSEQGIDLNGWQLKQAVAASADGRVIVGEGINPNGNTEAWIAVIAVPEPSTVALTCFLGIGFVLRRRP